MADSEQDVGHLLTRLDNITRAYRTFVSAEYNSLPPIQHHFSDETKQISTFDNYVKTRAIYYQAGYDRPAEILREIKEIVFLGRRVTLHKKFIGIFGDIREVLDRRSAGLANKVAGETKSITGFVPRLILGSTSISNHAFGLAIDVDPRSNPHIKSKNVIEVIDVVTGYDFGSRLDGDIRQCLLDHTQLEPLRKKIADASEKLRTWLNSYLPLYKNKDRQSFDKQTATQPALLNRLVKEVGIRDVESWAAHGIVTISLDFLTAMVELGEASEHSRWGHSTKRIKI